MNGRKMFSPEEIEKILGREGNVYFIGIGGVSMSSLALISKELGLSVGGSDRVRSPLTHQLQRDGITVQHGHDVCNIRNYTVVVYNAAIHSDNPEYAYASAAGLCLIYRSDFLGYIISKYKNSVGVAGTHGKSTTTAMIASVLTCGGLDPTVLNGAVMEDVAGAYRHGGTEYLAFEACEYMDSFLSFYPTVAVVLNAELDHADYFPSFERYIESFAEYLSHSRYGIVNIDSEGARRASRSYRGELLTCSLHGDGDITAKNISYPLGLPEFDICIRGAHFTHASLSVCGEHNISNALAAAGVAFLFGVDTAAVSASLHAFKGAARRFELRAVCNGARIYDDYAHHPTEIRATVAAAKKLSPRRLTVVFQPHTYTRTKSLFDSFSSAFDGCDDVIIADIYPARETDTLGMSAQLLADAVPGGKYLPSFESIAAYIKNTARDGDIVIIMGAGDINGIFDLL